MRYDRTAEAKSLAGEIAICLTFNGIMLDARWGRIAPLKLGFRDGLPTAKKRSPFCGAK
jgi:hypothetical protein